MYVHIRTYMYLCMYIYTYVHTFIHKRTVCTYMYAFPICSMYIHVCTCTYMYIHVYVLYVYISSPSLPPSLPPFLCMYYMYVHIHVCMYVCMYVHVCMYVYIVSFLSLSSSISLSFPFSLPPFLSATQGAPVERDTDNTTCVTNIDWRTSYACSLDMVDSSGWNITNPVTHQSYDLSTLGPTLSQIYVENGFRYNYTIGLAGNHIDCGSFDQDYQNPIGACQTRLDTGKSYILGRVNSTLQFIGEELRVEYRNGNFCHHVSAPRKAILSFVCNKTASTSGYLEVLPEEGCEYTFNIHTKTVCKEKLVPAVECFASGYATLGSFMSLKAPPISVPTGTAYVAVCGGVSPDNQVEQGSQSCPHGAAACLIPDRSVYAKVHSHLSEHLW